MKSDKTAAKIIAQAWDHTEGTTPMETTYYGLVVLGETELKRFKIAKNDYSRDRCAPCESYAKRMRDAVAKVLREEYGE